MYKKLIILIILVSSLVSSDIDIKSSQWNFVGVTSDVNISTFNLDSGDVIWSYNDNNWSCYLQDGDCQYSSVSQLNSGDGFWIKTANDKNITIDNGTSEKNISNGWNMITPVTNDINMTQYASDNNISFAFTYDDGIWSAYSQSEIMSSLGYPTIDIILKAQGAWVYKYNGSLINIGNEETLLTDGSFGTVQKSTSDSDEDIWNIKFKIDDSIDYTDLEIAVRFTKIEIGVVEGDTSNDIGEVKIIGLSITNKTINEPSLIKLYGHGDSGRVWNDYTSTKIPNSISLSNGLISLNLGTIFSVDDQINVRQSFTYKLEIISNQLIIPNSKKSTLDMEGFINSVYENQDGIEGYIEIK